MVEKDQMAREQRGREQVFERNIDVKESMGQPIESQDIEIVERKGLGHPDSICDGVAEAVCQSLSQAYMDRFGKVLHFNTDETQLVAGTAEPEFDGGEVVEPIYLLIVGRATQEYEGERFPAEKIALETAREYLDERFPFLDVGTEIVVDVRLGEGSGDLQDVFGDEERIPLSNDTSYGVGYAPFTETEQIVYEVERGLNGRLAIDNPAIGQDIKVMAKREGDHIDITVAVAIVDQFVENLREYKEKLALVESFVRELATEHTDRAVSVHVNTADDYESGSIYLTVTGTSAEHGDDGSVGRGNRANGLITPNRPMSLEASSGKNPVNHVGKIYNLLSTEIATTVTEEIDGIDQLHVKLVSQIGRPIDHPHVAEVTVSPEPGVELADVEPAVISAVDRQLESVTDITEQVLDGDLTTF